MDRCIVVDAGQVGGEVALESAQSGWYTTTKLQARNRVELAIYAFRHGLMDS